MVDYLWVLCAYFRVYRNIRLCVLMLLMILAIILEPGGHEWKMCFVFFEIVLPSARNKKCYLNDWAWKFFKLLLLINLFFFSDAGFTWHWLSRRSYVVGWCKSFPFAFVNFIYFSPLWLTSVVWIFVENGMMCCAKYPYRKLSRY